MDMKETIVFVGRLKQEIHDKEGTLFNAYLSGSKLYGWDSYNSDTDVRGMFSLNPRRYLGLTVPKETIQLHQIGEEYDVVMHELRKTINLALKGNCNILEGFSAPQIYKDAKFKGLQKLVLNSFGKDGLYNSYRGMAWQNYKKFILQGRNTVKKYLYVYRGLLAGRYVLTTGKIEPNMEVLAKYFRCDNAKHLLKIKRAGSENEPLSELKQGDLDLEIKELFDKIDDAYVLSELPRKPEDDDVKEVENYLINLRLEGL